MPDTQTDIAIFGDHDERTIAQLVRCLAPVEGARGALMPDGHLGYSAPIGGVMAYPEHVSPSGVGFDIGCGNKAVMTNLTLTDIAADVPRIMDEVQRRISFGMGRQNNEPIDHPVIDAIAAAEFVPQRGLRELAAKQLGTVGAGNHYVDVFADEADRVWVGVHFGSRGFGHKTASGFLAMAAGRSFTDHPPNDDMDAEPTLLATDSDLGQAYIAAMGLAGAYAYAGRDVVVDKVLEILGATALDEVHNHHNFAWRETHGGTDFWVVRKGATPAFDGQRGFVGSSMGEPSVILEGTGDERTLSSTVHGAGRAMSRTQAAGKQGQRAECSVRDCPSWVSWAHFRHEREKAGLREDERFTLCASHPDGKMTKRRGRLKEGRIDWAETTTGLRELGIELRGGAADEAPLAYKRLPEVLAAAVGIHVTQNLRLLGVAMADPRTKDDFRD